jgi:hypothetical protein
MFSKASNITKEPITMPQRNKLSKLPFAPESEAPPHRTYKASSVTTISVQTQKELMKHKKTLQRTLKDNWLWIGSSGFDAL